MRFALVDGERREAETGLRGECPGCGNSMIGNHGEIKVPYWRHESRRHCDQWWESETEWHRAWKNEFRDEWQEIRHTAPDGQVHIADVRTPAGWVLEFQHSAIDPAEREAREQFYSSLIWVIDGKRRKRDQRHFLGEVSGPASTGSSMTIESPGKSGLLREWIGSPAHVFFDFGDGSDLWWLWPGSGETGGFVYTVRRAQFIRSLARVDRYGPSKFDELVQHMKAKVAYASRPTPAPPHPPDPQQPPPRSPIVRRPVRRQFRF